MKHHKSAEADHTPESFKKGELFEKFILDNIFPKEDFDIMRKTPSFKDTQERYNHSAKLPDFQFIDKKSKQIFWVECKYRSYTNDLNQIRILERYQIERNNILKEPILYLIGLEGNPDNPNFIFQIPHEEIHPNVFFWHAKKFTIYEAKY